MIIFETAKIISRILSLSHTFSLALSELCGDALRNNVILNSEFPLSVCFQLLLFFFVFRCVAN
jgi:hypothetical protein